jgi:hypothetical protein
MQQTIQKRRRCKRALNRSGKRTAGFDTPSLESDEGETRFPNFIHRRGKARRSDVWISQVPEQRGELLCIGNRIQQLDLRWYPLVEMGAAGNHVDCRAVDCQIALAVRIAQAETLAPLNGYL